MKSCVKCQKEFEDSFNFCPYDGQELVVIILDGRYRLHRCIGQGGMGRVYSASHLELKNHVAVKIILPDRIKDAVWLKRFKREAQAAGRIKHPNIVSVSDYGQTSEGLAYMVMEYVEGRSLSHLLEQEKRLLPQRAINLGYQICLALAAAHERHIVHRDIKPDNVMIEQLHNEERVRVLDFGIAKLKDIKDIEHPHLTDTGSLLGTPSYMSPEHCKGETIDHRADIYSLGILLYQMLTGVLPFTGNNSQAIIYKHISELPRPLYEVYEDIPHLLSKVVMQALEKEARKCPQTASQFAQQLLDALQEDNQRTYEYVTVRINHKSEIVETWSKRSEDLKDELVNGIIMDMVKLPMGRFLMGSPTTERGRYHDEGPQHEVSINEFYMGKYQVTQEQWRAVVALPKIGIDLEPDQSYFKGDHRPVECVS